VQAAKGAPSRLHSKVLPASLEVKLKLASGLLLGSGGLESIVVSGAAASTVQL
jgi:hypothetical protein